MEQDTDAQPTMAELVARTGANVTPEGRARARQRLAESRQRHAEHAGEGEAFLVALRTRRTA